MMTTSANEANILFLFGAACRNETGLVCCGECSFCMGGGGSRPSQPHRSNHRLQYNEKEADNGLLLGKQYSDFSEYYYGGFAYLHLAELGEGVHNLSLSLRAFDRAIAINPDDADSYVNRGIARRYLAAISPDQMSLSDSIGDFDQAIHLDPGYADAFANRGIAYLYQGKLEESQADFAKAVEISGDLSTTFQYDQAYWKQLIDTTVDRIKRGNVK